MKTRLKLLLVLALMPEEAFGWFVGWAQGMPVNYPDGLGGFRQDSRDAILDLRAAAKDYVPDEETLELRRRVG